MYSHDCLPRPWSQQSHWRVSIRRLHRTVQPSASIPRAPIGQPATAGAAFLSRSGAEQVEQERMSAFDAEQKKFDQELDRKLNICRC